MKKKKKLILGIIISLIVVGIIIGLSTTSALFAKNETNTRRNNYNTGILSVTAISKSDTISLDNTLPMSDEDGEKQEAYIFTIKNNGNVDYKFDIQLLSTNANTFSSEYIRLKVNNDDITTLGALENSKIKTGLVLAAQETIDISIRVWLDINTPNTQIGKTFTSKLVINGIAASPSTNKTSSAAAYITNLYNNSEKEKVETNDYAYNFSVSESLVNDRLGGITKDLNAGNIRYYGSNPNNYIYFNCEDYQKGNTDEEPNNCELWRIIGVFDNMIKIMKNDSIGSYSWNILGENNWQNSQLKELLNTGDYWNNSINNITKNMIAEVIWNTNGFDYTRESNYNKEKVGDKWQGKVALMSLSDYFYSESKECYTENNIECSSWITDNKKSSVLNTEKISISNNEVKENTQSNDKSDIYPVVFLNSELSIYSGNGTKENPYTIR